MPIKGVIMSLQFAGNTCLQCHDILYLTKVRVCAMCKPLDESPSTPAWLLDAVHASAAAEGAEAVAGSLPEHRSLPGPLCESSLSVHLHNHASLVRSLGVAQLDLFL